MKRPSLYDIEIEGLINEQFDCLYRLHSLLKTYDKEVYGIYSPELEDSIISTSNKYKEARHKTLQYAADFSMLFKYFHDYSELRVKDIIKHYVQNEKKRDKLFQIIS